MRLCDRVLRVLRVHPCTVLTHSLNRLFDLSAIRYDDKSVSLPHAMRAHIDFYEVGTYNTYKGNIHLRKNDWDRIQISILRYIDLLCNLFYIRNIRKESQQ